MNPHLEVFSALSSHQLKLLRKIARNGVRYLVVGGYAVRYHGYLRSAIDLDLFVDRSPKNVKRVLKALSEVGAKNLDTARDCLLQPKKKVTWYDVELFTSMEGIEFEEVSHARLLASVGMLKVPVISREHLILTKRLALADPERATRRHVDCEDLRALLGCDENAV